MGRESWAHFSARSSPGRDAKVIGTMSSLRRTCAMGVLVTAINTSSSRTVHQVLWGYGERYTDMNAAKRESKMGRYEDSFTFHQFCHHLSGPPQLLATLWGWYPKDRKQVFYWWLRKCCYFVGHLLQGTRGAISARRNTGGRQREGERGQADTKIQLRTTATWKSLPTPAVVWKPRDPFMTLL